MRKDRITYHIDIVCLDKFDAQELRELAQEHLRQKAKVGEGDGIFIMSHREFPANEPVKLPTPGEKKLKKEVVA